MEGRPAHASSSPHYSSHKRTHTLLPAEHEYAVLATALAHQFLPLHFGSHANQVSNSDFALGER